MVFSYSSAAARNRAFSVSNARARSSTMAFSSKRTRSSSFKERTNVSCSTASDSASAHRVTASASATRKASISSRSGAVARCAKTRAGVCFSSSEEPGVFESSFSFRTSDEESPSSKRPVFEETPIEMPKRVSGDRGAFVALSSAIFSRATKAPISRATFATFVSEGVRSGDPFVRDASVNDASRSRPGVLFSSRTGVSRISSSFERASEREDAPEKSRESSDDFRESGNAKTWTVSFASSSSSSSPGTTNPSRSCSWCDWTVTEPFG